MGLCVCEIFFRLWMTSHSISEVDGFGGASSCFWCRYCFISLCHSDMEDIGEVVCVWMLMNKSRAVPKGSLESCSPKLTDSQKCLSEVLVPSVHIQISVRSLAHSADSCCAPAGLHKVQPEQDRQGGAPPCPVLHWVQVDSHSWSQFAGCGDWEDV